MAFAEPLHFQTQQEAYARASGAPAPENICFYTYAALSMMDEQMLEELRADCIILDEFHRCGAKEWNRGVEALLEQCPDAPVLGLTATSIRYLDNQRDMADELFDGCIASEMTLGEAVGRGILPAPKYVISLYSCREEPERYRHALDERAGDAVARMYECAAQYVRDHEGIVKLLMDENKPQLRLWYRRQERKRRDGKLSAAQTERLDALSV